MHLVGLPFCLTLDQVEDTINAIVKHPATPWDLLTPLLVRLSRAPGFSMLFFVQASVWQELSAKVPPMLRERITEGDGAQKLSTLKNAAAEAVVRARMDACVWRDLDAEGTGPPADQPLFPFTREEVHQLRKDANSELRPFLRLLHERYAQAITPKPPPAPVITSILPVQVLPHESQAVRIKGRYFRPEVTVFLASREITPVTYHPKEGTEDVIEITTPVGLLGEVEVRVQAMDDPQRFATSKLLFVDSLPRPYAHSIDRVKVRKRRTEMGMIQKQVGDRVGVTASRISAFETNRWNPSDEVIEGIVAALGGTLADFRKDAPGGGP
jgi:DNA-binding XRE family transcriptional regulator